MKPELHLVDNQPAYDDFSSRVKIMALREKLMGAAVRYVRHGNTGSQNDRLREASDMAGIPRQQLEVEVRNPLRT